MSNEIRTEEAKKPTIQIKQKQENHFSKLQKGMLGLTCGAMLMGAFSFIPMTQHEAEASKKASALTSTATNKAAVASSLVTSVQPVAAHNYVQVARDAARKYGIDPNLFVRQIRQESGFNPNALSWVGAIGIAQFMPATARAMGVNPYNPVNSLYGAARLMRDLRRQFGGDYSKALAAYNAGPGAVQRAVRLGGKNWLAYMPNETKHYVRVIR